MASGRPIWSPTHTGPIDSRDSRWSSFLERKALAPATTVGLNLRTTGRSFRQSATSSFVALCPVTSSRRKRCSDTRESEHPVGRGARLSFRATKVPEFIHRPRSHHLVLSRSTRDKRNIGNAPKTRVRGWKVVRPALPPRHTHGPWCAPERASSQGGIGVIRRGTRQAEAGDVGSVAVPSVFAQLREPTADIVEPVGIGRKHAGRCRPLEATPVAGLSAVGPA